jgi:hypothetical protein
MKTKLIAAILIAVHPAAFRCAAAENPGTASPVVATVLEKKISAADIGLRCDASNKPIIPEDAPSTCLLRNPLDELQTKIMREIARDYIKKNNLKATDEEIREFQESQDRFMAQDRIKRQKKLAELDKKLQDTSLNATEKDQTEKYRATLLSLAAHDKRQDEFNKSIYDKYGGTVGMTKFGPEPAGAAKCLLEDYEKQGKIMIYDEDLRRDFRKRLSTPPEMTAQPEDIDFTPYWKKPIPDDKE